MSPKVVFFFVFCFNLVSLYKNVSFYTTENVSPSACFLLSHYADSMDCKEEKDLHLSDLEDIDGDDCDKLDSDSEKVAVDEQDLQKRGCSSDLHLSLTNSFHTFPGAIKGVTTLPSLPSDFLDPISSKAPSSTGTAAGTVSLSHFEIADKPRIWSLAHTAASGVILGPQQHGSDLRTGSSAADCHIQSSRLSGASPGQCGGMRGLHESSTVNNIDSPFTEATSLHSKVYGTSSYRHKDLQLHCASYVALPNTCQYSSIEGIYHATKKYTKCWFLNKQQFLLLLQLGIRKQLCCGLLSQIS